MASARLVRVLPAFALAALTACAVRQRDGSPASAWAADEAAIRAATTASADAWNRGDLRGHLAIYADSVTFMTRTGPRTGARAIEQEFSRVYFSEGKPKQALGFEQIVIRRLDSDTALQIGRFVLSGGGQPDQTGWFTLVWTRTAAGWKAVHDHSS
ncbi:MAG: DUF4440 domain-containing protein [Gemmatimonadaceae bacterium]